MGRLRGAVPIIFATYPVVAGVEGSNLIFNIVFFITIVSLVVQGTTMSFVARILNLSKPLEKTGNDFGVELPEEIDSDLSDMTITTNAGRSRHLEGYESSERNVGNDREARR